MSDTAQSGQHTTDEARTLGVEAQRVASSIGSVDGLTIYPRSVVATPRASFFLGRKGEAKFVGVIAGDRALLDRFHGGVTPVRFDGRESIAKIGEANSANAGALRDLLPFLVPRPLGLRRSAGCGDRLGLATPGHVRAIRRSSMAPVLAQQSIRENARTGRTPQGVIDDAMWGVLQEGWREGYGADADHLKTTADVDQCAIAGFTFYTIDPSDHVDNSANHATLDVLEQKIGPLPWDALETTWTDLRRRLSRPLDLGTTRLTITDEELLRAAAKYARVVSHTVEMFRHLRTVMDGRPFELEMSVDESDTVTTVAEHVYIATELQRLGVRWISLAPRYVGDFEKGVNYIGDPADFERSFALHRAVAATLGPYKLSLHSGSDKFAIFPIAARVAQEHVHLKTSGTSYLEALRAIATLDPDLFREIVVFACERYPADRASYHVSAQVERMPDVASLANHALPSVLDQFDAREILHVTYGSVLSERTLSNGLFATLRGNEETYYSVLETHFAKHFAAFEGIGSRLPHSP